MKNLPLKKIPTSQGIAPALMMSMLIAIPVVTQAQVLPTFNSSWNGSGAADDWFSAANWTGGVPALQSSIGGTCPPLPVSLCSIPPNVSINNGGSTAKVSAAATANLNRLFVGIANSGGLELNSGGTMVLVGVSDAFSALGYSAGGSGTVTITGTSSRLTASSLRIGHEGSGTLNLADGGTLRMGTGTGTLNIAFGDGSTGILNIGSGSTAGILQASTVQFGTGTGSVVFNHNHSDYSFGSAFSGNGALDFMSGTTILTANSQLFRGTATVRNGAKLVLGADNFGYYVAPPVVEPPAPPPVPDPFNNTASLTIQNGTLATHADMSLGRAAVTRKIYGDLLFNTNSIIEFGLGLAAEESVDFGVGDVIEVGGLLKLDGTLDVYDLGGFSFGRYELFRYGTFDGDSNLDIIGNLGSGLPGSLSNDSANNRIILVVEQALGSKAWWNGGADGIWSNAAESWSAEDSGGGTLFPWNEGTAIFNGGGGVVTVTEAVNFSEISFEANGYVIADGGGAVYGKPVDDDETIVNLNAMPGITGEIATGLRESRPGLQMRKYSTGTLILSSEDNLWTGGTTIEQGTLQIGNSEGTTGRLPGNVTNGGTLAFNRSNAYTYAGVISGGGQVRQTGSGTTILTGNHTYSGLTTISNGTLQIGDAGTGSDSGRLGSGSVSIGAAGTLAFKRSGDFIGDNAITTTITGSGQIAQRGGGTLQLNGLSTFTGKLLAESGRILIGGTFNGTADVSDRMTVNGTSGAINVLSGGVLGGTGTINGITVRDGGTLSPGNSIGTLTVNGDLEFQAGATYEVEADNVGGADRVNVTGDVTLDGLLSVVAGPNDATLWNPPLNQYTVLTYTGTRTGTFDTDIDSNLLFLTPSLEYGNGVVTLHLNRNDIRFGELAGLTPNQRAAGAALESVGLDHSLTLSGVTLYDLAVNLGELATAQAAFDAVSGEIHASLAGMLLDDSRLLRDAVLGQSFEGLSQQEGRYWFQALGHQGRTQGDGVSELKRDAVGLLVGWDSTVFSDRVRLGWALGYHMNASAEVNALRSKGKANTTHAAIYGGTQQDQGLGVRLGASYSWHEVDVERTVVFTGRADELVNSDYQGNTLQAFGEVDWRLQVNGMNVAPFIGLAWARLETDAFMEADFLSPIGSTASLGAVAQAHDASFATLGARGEMSLREGLQLKGMVGYRRVLSGEDPRVRLGFLDGGQRFEVIGAPMARDAALMDLGLDFALSEKVHLGAAYNGLLGSDATDHAIQARLVWTLE